MISVGEGFITTTEAVERYGVKRSTVNKWIRETLKHIEGTRKIAGRNWIFSEGEFKKLVDRGFTQGRPSTLPLCEPERLVEILESLLKFKKGAKINRFDVGIMLKVVGYKNRPPSVAAALKAAVDKGLLVETINERGTPLYSLKEDSNG